MGLRPQARASEQPPDRAALGESLRCLRRRRMRVREKPTRRISSVRSLTRPDRATLPHGEGFAPIHYYLFTLHFLLLPPPGEVPATQGIGVYTVIERSAPQEPFRVCGPTSPGRGGKRRRHHKPSPWGKVPAQRADEGPRKSSATHRFGAVPHPTLTGHPPPRGGLTCP